MEIHLDHASWTPIYPKVRSAIEQGDLLPPFHLPYAKDGQKEIASFRNSLEKLIGIAPSDTTIITSSSAENFSHWIQGLYFGEMSDSGKNGVAYLSIESANTIQSIRRFEKYGIQGREIPLPKGAILTSTQLKTILTPRLSCLTIQWGHPLLGVVQPVWEIASFCKEHGIFLHVEATEVVGKLLFRFSDLSIHAISLDLEKLHGPRRSAIFAHKPFLPIHPLIDGGWSQSSRGGSVDRGTILGANMTLEMLYEYFDYSCTELVRLRDLFEEIIIEKIPDAQVLFTDVERVPHISVISFGGAFGEFFQYQLAKRSLSASIGGGEQQTLFSLLKGLGYSEEIAASSLSFSLSRFTTEEQIIEAAHRVIETYLSVVKSFVEKV